MIDPHGVMRAMIYYPLTTGRNMSEIIRLVDALQLNTEKGVACPANWQPGDDVIIPAPITKAGADKRPSEGYNTIDWYISKAPQPK